MSPPTHRMLLARGKTNEDPIRMIGGWRHSGFNVYAGPWIHPREKRCQENLAAYLIRSSFSQQRMEYRPEEAKVTYRYKDRKEKKSYDAPEWLAAMGKPRPGERPAVCALLRCSFCANPRSALRVTSRYNSKRVCGVAVKGWTGREGHGQYKQRQDSQPKIPFGG